MRADPAGAPASRAQANGLIDTVTHGSGASAVEEHWVPDPNGMARPMMIEMIAPATTRWQEYAFDGAGNIVRIGNTSYTYDPLNRLTNWTEWFGTNVYGSTTRITDGFGNHLYTIQKGCGSSGRCFDTGFVPLAVDAGSNHYAHETYDDAGNVVSDGTHTFAYDGAGRMVSLIGNGRNERYLYTADDERIAIVKRIATANGTKNKTEWTLRGTNNQLLRTFTDNSETGTRVWSWTEDEIWRGSNLLASESSSGRKQYHLDHLGSSRWVTTPAAPSSANSASNPSATAAPATVGESSSPDTSAMGATRVIRLITCMLVTCSPARGGSSASIPVGSTRLDRNPGIDIPTRATTR